MRCPLCQFDDTRVIDSRPAERQTAIRRRRECPSCDHRFTTYERIEAALMVRKRSGRLEPFMADKLHRGVSSALADRPVPVGAVDRLVDAIESEAGAAGAVVTSEDLGRMVLEHLRELDEVAYLRFASVYKDFRAVEDFERELAELESVNPID